VSTDAGVFADREQAMMVLMMMLETPKETPKETQTLASSLEENRLTVANDLSARRGALAPGRNRFVALGQHRAYTTPVIA
jgi:hypothetical protein